MQVIIFRNTSIAGKSIAGDPNKIHDLADEVAAALINAGKARKAVTPAKTAKAKKQAGE